MKTLLIAMFLVTGQFLFADEPAPQADFMVGLCEVLNDGTVCAYSINPPAHKVTPAADGTFTIEDVPPGWYGLVFDFGYFFQMMPDNPDGSGPILLHVTDDVDLGTFAYDDKPCIPGVWTWGCPKLYLPVVFR